MLFFFKQKYFCVCFSSCFQRMTDQDYRQVTLVSRSFNSRICFFFLLFYFKSVSSSRADSNSKTLDYHAKDLRHCVKHAFL